MIITQYKNFAEVLSKSSLFDSRMELARSVLKFDIANELFSLGVFGQTKDDVNRIIEGLPEDILAKELAKRM